MRSKTILALALLLWSHGSARAATQEVLGKLFLLKDPKPVGNPGGVDPTKRKALVLGKASPSLLTVMGDPVANGATVTLVANGAHPSTQMVTIPPGLLSGGQGWQVTSTGFVWINQGPAGIPVKKVIIKKTPGGQFLLKVLLTGDLSGPGVLVAPPAAGTEEGMIFTIGGGGDTYCVKFGGPAGGEVIDNPTTGPTAFAELHKIVSTRLEPTRTSGCPAASACNVLITWGTSGSGNGQFKFPAGVAEKFGTVVVADTMNDRMQAFDANGNFGGTWGTSGSGDGQFKDPNGIALDGPLTLYVADEGNDRIQKFTSLVTFQLKWGTTGTGDGQFRHPVGVAVDGSGNVYVADERNDRIQKFDGSGTFLTKWGVTGTGNGEFDSPEDVAVDGSGNVYVADMGNDRIQKFDSAGTFLTKWGSFCRFPDGSGCVDPDGPLGLDVGDGQFDAPSVVSVDGSGNVYVADSNDRIQKFDSSGAFLGRWGTTGSAPGQFRHSGGLAVDGSGNVFISDRHRIQKFGSCP